MQRKPPVNQRGFGLVGGLLIATLIAAVGFGGYYVWNENQDETSENAETGAEPTTNNISSFQECVDAGNPVMESFPEQCSVPNGETFINEGSEGLISPEEEQFASNAQLKKYLDEELGFSIYLPAEGAFETYLSYNISNTNISDLSETPVYNRNLGGECWVTLVEDGEYKRYVGESASIGATPNNSDGLDIEGEAPDGSTRLCQNVSDDELIVSSLGGKYYSAVDGDAGFTRSISIFQSAAQIISISFETTIWGEGDASSENPNALSGDESEALYELVRQSRDSLQIL